MIRKPLQLAAMLVLASVTLTPACDENNPMAPEYDPDIPTDWVAAVSNSYFPLVPGTVYEYEGQTDEGLETITVEVLSAAKVVMGVSATVVRDRVYLDGELIEDTQDWYAQDGSGNVWYLGEDSKEIEGGVVVSTEGSWEWGVDGALPGVIMWGDPAAHLDEEYRQEFYEDEAEDWGKVVAVNQSVDVPFGSFNGCIQTEDWNALEPGTLEAKYYCPQVGFVLEMKIEGGDEVVELVQVTLASGN